MSADLVDIFPPHAVARRSPAAEARHLHPAALPHWRALLGSLRQQRQERATGLWLACRDAREAAADASGGPDAAQAAWRRASAMWHRAVAEWRALGEIEEALSRLATGRFGWCQHCGAAIAAGRLTEMPQARYCPSCDE
jgi:RNA polymerase-binding transcription factor DksA